jgi:inosine triphosphate pyrophosphatase
MNRKIFYITGNASKFEEAVKIWNHPVYQLDQIQIELEEYQDTSKNIAIKKAIEAAKYTDKFPYIVEDVSLEINALGKFPGPYIKWFLKALTLANIYKIVSVFDDHSAQAICTLAVKESQDAQPVVFEGIVKGTIVAPRGTTNFGWDPIFEPIGQDANVLVKTFAEMSKDEKNKISHRCAALTQLKHYLIT